MPTLKFFDVKGKKVFSTDKYTLRKIKNTHFAIAKAPSGIDAYRIVSKSFYNKEGK